MPYINRSTIDPSPSVIHHCDADSDVFHVSTCIQSAAKSPTKTFLLYTLCINIVAHYYASFIDSSFTVFCLRAIMLSVNQQKNSRINFSLKK